MQLSDHFSLEEFTASEVASRHGIDNVPSPEIVKRLIATATQLEHVRFVLAQPMHVNSGYRSAALNAAIGGAANSAHVKGWAVDFICPAVGPPYVVAVAIRAAQIRFDQLILEYGWVHISFDPLLRGEFLTKKSAAAPYEIGLIE